eukprot:9856891-Karenia_brevis.AAC.1
MVMMMMMMMMTLMMMMTMMLLDNMEHQIVAQKGKLLCHNCGQMWSPKRQMLEQQNCPGPQIWGTPQRNRLW